MRNNFRAYVNARKAQGHTKKEALNLRATAAFFRDVEALVHVPQNLSMSILLAQWGPGKLRRHKNIADFLVDTGALLPATRKEWETSSLLHQVRELVQGVTIGAPRTEIERYLKHLLLQTPRVSPRSLKSYVQAASRIIQSVESPAMTTGALESAAKRVLKDRPGLRASMSPYAKFRGLTLPPPDRSAAAPGKTPRLQDFHTLVKRIQTGEAPVDVAALAAIIGSLLDQPLERVVQTPGSMWNSNTQSLNMGQEEFDVPQAVARAIDAVRSPEWLLPGKRNSGAIPRQSVQAYLKRDFQFGFGALRHAVNSWPAEYWQ